jgi:hypothetical protein
VWAEIEIYMDELVAKGRGAQAPKRTLLRAWLNAELDVLEGHRVSVDSVVWRVGRVCFRTSGRETRVLAWMLGGVLLRLERHFVQH